MITGAHIVIRTKDPGPLRAFFRDVLGLPNIDDGGGSLIFALPPAEMGVIPSERSMHELYFVCDDIEATVAQLKAKGVEFEAGISERPWGRVATVTLPDGSQVAMYQPKHLTALALKS